MFESFTYASPAKVNLYLKVVGKRADGYHDIVSVVDIISLKDVLHIEAVPDSVISVDDTKHLLPSGPANTIYKAAALLKEKFRIKEGAHITVDKKIPIGAGLGGPSSNAATALKALVKAWSIPVSNDELLELGSKIGADVPLFLYGKPCIMRGIGEQITPIEIPFIWYVLVYPGIVLRTKDVYAGVRIPLTLTQNHITLSAQFETILDVARMLQNDLETVAFALHPEIYRVKERLRGAGAIGSLMSGSGSSVFGVFENEGDARVAARKVCDSGSVFIAHSRSRRGTWKSPALRSIPSLKKR
jgi:4-diphosphocytidyl-2-C-methyl-D-erythritol kinase